MAEAGLHGLPKRRRGRRNLANVATHEDLVNRNFAAVAPNALWLSDITEHKTREGTLYCCVVLDQHSRRVVGWALADHMETSLVADALRMAIAARRPSPGLIFHADRGCQGGINWPSQHLKHGGVAWHDSQDGWLPPRGAQRFVRRTDRRQSAIIVDRFRRRGHRRSRGEKTASDSGGRSLAA